VEDYFSLWGPRPVFGGQGAENQRQVWLFIGVALGAICKAVYDALTHAEFLEWKSMLIGAIASLVVFPQLYYTGGLNRRKLSFAHWTLAFQNGFFWSVALNALFKKFGA
jgi:hypothetical protein